MFKRQYNLMDTLCLQFDQAVRTCFGKPVTTTRVNPATNIDEQEMTDGQRKEVAGLMRVNHAGEVSAQALYQGQALTAKLADVRDSMETAAQEENDHLDWCQSRLQELGSHTSYLTPFWYGGSFAIGALAGIAGDKWSLGFVAETEHQVVRHLEEHLQRLPENDARSRAILEQMKEDEAHHATTAINAGGAPLPAPVKKLMQLTSKVMTRTAYWI